MPNESNSADRAVEAYLQGYIQGFTDLHIETIRELYPLREILSHINPTLEELAREAESVCEERLHNSPGGQLLAALFTEIANAETGTDPDSASEEAHRDFDLGDILSVTTGTLLSPRKMAGLYDILGYMTGEDLYTHQLGRAAAQCKPIIIARYPHLAHVLTDDVTPDNWVAWLDEKKALFGDTLAIAPLVGNAPRNPLEELAEMVPPEKIIVVSVRTDPDPEETPGERVARRLRKAGQPAVTDATLAAVLLRHQKARGELLSANTANFLGYGDVDRLDRAQNAETDAYRDLLNLLEAGQPVITGAGLDQLVGDVKACGSEGVG